MTPGVADLRAEQARAQRALLREMAAPALPVVPVRDLVPNHDYLMTWGGFTSRVKFARRPEPFGPGYFSASGWWHSLETVPDAVFHPLPEAHK